MRDYLKFYIDGQWVEPTEKKTLDVINPATEEVCGKIALGSAADVDKALHEIVAGEGGKSQEQAKEYIEAMKAAKRYRRDVY